MAAVSVQTYLVLLFATFGTPSAVQTGSEFFFFACANYPFFFADARLSDIRIAGQRFITRGANVRFFYVPQP